jgi:outer membrane lipoprotein-sorting protein
MIPGRTESSNTIGGRAMCKTFFGTLVLVFALGGVASADDQADAKAILDEGIKAQGGESAMSKFVAIYAKSKGTSYEAEKKTPLSYEWFCQGFDKMRTVSFDENNKVVGVEVLNGKEGWVKDGDQATEQLSSEDLESRHEFIYMSWATMLVPLKAQGFRLSPLDETSVAGRKAVGILVSHDKHNPLKLYFDKETHLLVKSQCKDKNLIVGKEVDEECVYSDYRNVEETKQSFRVEEFWDGVKATDLLVSEMKLYEKPLDDKLFSKP